MIYDCIIIGGGASGLMLASRLKVNKGLILEGSSRCGTKLLMAGGGRCNITHEGSIKDFLQCYGANGSKIRTCLYKHSNLELMSFLEDNGLPLMTNEEGRVFPASEKAKDVLDLLLKLAGSNGWQIMTDSKVSNISQSPAGYSVKVSGNKYTSDKLVIATGGITYPKTGSDGSMLGILEQLGVEIIKPTSVLAPLRPENYPYGELSGISLRNVRVSTGEGKKAARAEGDLLFAHKEFSGPAILNISRDAAPGKHIFINYIPDEDNPFEKLVAAVSGSKADISTALAETFRLPKRFAACICERASGTRKATATRDGISLKHIIELLTRDEFVIASRGDNGMVTAGGVALSEISSKTMELKQFPGIYVIGEALDIDGITGGYNLQFAYSSASAAADAITAD